MKLTRGSLALAALSCLVGLELQAQDRPAEAAAEQLKVAQEAFAKLGASYEAMTHRTTKEMCHGFRMPQDTTDAELKRLPNPLFPFRLTLSFTRVTDVGLRELKDLKALVTLDLRGTSVTDAGLKELNNVKALTTLDLGGTSVTDVGLKELKNLKALTTLDLSLTWVTDAGLKDLKALDLGGTSVTNAGLKELQQASPGCYVRR